jgi:hypothetical protein
VEHLVGPLTEDADRLALHVPGVIAVDRQAAGACEFGQHLAVHGGVGAALVGRATLDADVVG